MKKIISLVLCLALLCGCMSAFAEGVVAHFTATEYGEIVADLLANLGFDADGCAHFDVAGQVDGENGDILLQVSEEAITIGMGEEVYTVTAEELGKVLYDVAMLYLEQYGVDTDELLALIGLAQEYVNSGALYADLAVFEQILMNEANNLAYAAMMTGILAVSDAGDVTIEATDDTLIQFAATYLNMLAAGTSVDDLAATQIWNLLGLPADTAAIKDAIVSVSGELAAAADNETDVYFRLDVFAEGYGTFTFIDTDESVQIDGGFNGENVHFTVNDGEMIVNVTIASTGFGFSVEEGDEIVDFDLVCADNVVLITANANIEGMTMDMNYCVDLLTGNLDTVINVNGQEYVTGKVWTEGNVVYVEGHVDNAVIGGFGTSDMYEMLDLNTYAISATTLENGEETTSVIGGFDETGVYTLVVSEYGETVGTIEVWAEEDEAGYTVINLRINDGQQAETVKLKYQETGDSMSAILELLINEFAIAEFKLDMQLTDIVYEHVNGYELTAEMLESMLF